MFYIGQHCCPNWRPRGRGRIEPRGRIIRRIAGPAAGGEGAPGGKNKQPAAAASGTKVASKKSGSPLGASSRFDRRPDTGEGAKGAERVIASETGGPQRPERLREDRGLGR